MSHVVSVLGLVALLAGLSCSAGLQAQPADNPLRPQLSAADAARHSAAAYLAQGPTPWLPAKLRDMPLWRADFTVAADGSGSHRSVQAAIDAVPARSQSSQRHVIRIQPGTYRETLCMRHKAPITLVGAAGGAAAVLIVEGRYNAQPRQPATAADQACWVDLAGVAGAAKGTYGTPGSATVVIDSDDVQLLRLTIANDAMDPVRQGQGYPPGAGESGGAQAVALLAQGDRLQLQQVSLLGHQDTFFVRRPAPGAAARVWAHNSLIAGDVDFIFGDGTLVVDDSTVLSRAGRRAPGNGGHVLAPSTPAAAAFGFLVQGSRFDAEPGVAPNSISLGRAWDQGVPAGTWQPGASPNGQALVRSSWIGPHIASQADLQRAPWAASTARRPFSAVGLAANRLVEFGNADMDGPADTAGTGHVREVLAPDDGWAAAAGGTQGGAAALPGDVITVRNRAELVLALAPQRVRAGGPRIVLVQGQIDLDADEMGRPLGAEADRDPAFNWPDFLRAYQPATWGKQPPDGPLEAARQRSARAQAARVVLRVPSNTTLIGQGPGARLVGGMLLLDTVDNVIIRNLHFSDAYDHFPLWDPKDNAGGEWNSEYDNLSLRGATHVWIDHCTFDDGERPDSAEPLAFNRPMQRHDGLLDITQQSNHITVSWNHFRQHDKTTLVGSSDKQQADEGRLKVTFHHNLWQDVHERAPRVRYGQVHLYNNLYLGHGAPVQRHADTPADTPGHPLGYSIGVGVGSRIYSQRNAWLTTADITPGRLTRWWKGSLFFDQGSLHNGQPVDVLAALLAANPAASVAGDVGWLPTLVGTVDAAQAVPAKVRAGAGAGRGLFGLVLRHN